MISSLGRNEMDAPSDAAAQLSCGYVQPQRLGILYPYLVRALDADRPVVHLGASGAVACPVLVLFVESVPSPRRIPEPVPGHHFGVKRTV